MYEERENEKIEGKGRMGITEMFGGRRFGKWWYLKGDWVIILDLLITLEYSSIPLSFMLWIFLLFFFFFFSIYYLRETC